MEQSGMQQLNKKILCSICTRGRYDTTLPMSLMSVALQTRTPNKVILYDDNPEPVRLTDLQHYEYIFRTFDEKQIEWEVVFGQKRGQHFSHELANNSGYEFVWRIDDDVVAEPTVLETLMSYMDDTVGAVGGSVLTPPSPPYIVDATGKIEYIREEPNIQWGRIIEQKEVDHLHCSYLYRAGIEPFNLLLSKVAHREETLHTFGIKRKGYKVLVVPGAVVWHYKNKQGGIRSEDTLEMYNHDESVFNDQLRVWNIDTTGRKFAILDCGIGDHFAFKHILKDMKEIYGDVIIAATFPDTFWDEDVKLISIADAKLLYGDIDLYNIYRNMIDWNWKGTLVDAFRKLYNVPEKK